MDEVHLVDYDPRWPEMYDAEVNRLRAVIPPELVWGVEHFGSTAVPGLVAKPIIDILMAVRSLREAREVAIRPLESIGYAFWADNPKKDRMFFVKGLPPTALHRTHHVHMTELGGEMWGRLVFRDYLRRHPEEVARYSVLKRELAAQHRFDREAYTTAKAAYVDMIMDRARTESPTPPS